MKKIVYHFIEFKRSTVKISLLFISVIMIWVCSNTHWGKDNWKWLMQSDAQGYYSYLPAIFIYSDLNFYFAKIVKDKNFFPDNSFYEFRIGTSTGKPVNKCYAGVALMQLPFFLIAHMLSNIFGYDTHGYSKLYFIFVNIATIFYLLAGLIYTNKLLKLYNLKENVRAVTLWVILFGTNLFYYCIQEPGISHVYSFSMIAFFAFYTKRFFIIEKKYDLYKIAFLLALICLIRPVNIIMILAIPFLAGDVKTLRMGVIKIFKKIDRLLFSVFLFIAIISIQFIIYKISTGQFIIYSYAEEGFVPYPSILKFLFSYKKGFFVYTPIMLVSLLGLIYLWKKNKYEFITFLLFLFTVVYILSSWWQWYYGGSFGSRVMIDFYSFFAIVLGFKLNNIRKKALKRLFIILLFLLIVVNQIQTYQYRYGQIHWVNMNKESYWSSFMRIDKLIK